MSMTAAELAERVGGTVVGDGTVVVRRAASLRDAQEGDLSFLSNARHAAEAAVTAASVVIAPASWSGACPAVRVNVANPDRAFGMAAVLLAPPAPRFAPGVHPTAVLAPGVQLGEDVCVGPYCVLEEGVQLGARSVLVAHCYLGHGVVVGEDCRLHPFVSVREYVRIGARVVLHNGVVVGSDGFGYFREGEAWRKIPQVGIVEIGDDVELGANTTVDRARFGRTVIGKGVKVDNLVQIAHNVRVGEHSALAAQVGLAGSAELGRGVQVGGQTGIAGHLCVGDFTVVAALSGVTKTIGAGMAVSGFPAMDHNKERRMHAHVMRIPELKKRVAGLEARLEALEAANRAGPAGTGER